METENEVKESSTPLVPVEVLDELMAQVEAEGAELWALMVCCPR